MANVTNPVARARSAGHPRTDPRQPEFGRPDAPATQRPDFTAIARSSEFVRLRRTHRRFVFPLCLAFFAWYMLYVLLAAYAHDFMSRQVFGLINVGLLLGVLQFVSTGAITVFYIRYARRRLDPQVDAIRAKVEGTSEGEQR